MRRAVLVLAAAVVLAGPTVLAFYSGGYFREPRLIGAVVAWLLVLALTITGPAPLPRSLPGRLALAGLVGITAWSALSIAWAPLAGPATENVERLVLYIGALLLAIGVLRPPPVRRAVEPALAAGATVVICYGLSGRLLPGIVHLAQSARAGGRLEQPITYWNAQGALAAIGLVLCGRLAGDATRPLAVRSLAAAAAAPLGAGVYLSYSRGAIAAALVGFTVLVAISPVRGQVRAAIAVLVTAAAAAACSSAFPGVASLSGQLAAREREGMITLLLLMALAAGAGSLTVLGARAERRIIVRDSRILGGRWRVVIPTVSVALVMAGLVMTSLGEKADAADLARASSVRLTSVSSNRYEYWKVGVDAFRRQPFTGVGSGGFRIVWLRERSISESVRDVHSLELEMAVELGIVGLFAFGIMVGGVAMAARRALERDRAMAAGSCAATVVWLLHASIDWDWQLPAVTLPAILLAALLIALAEARPEPLSESPRRFTTQRGDRAGAELPSPAEPRRDRVRARR